MIGQLTYVDINRLFGIIQINNINYIVALEQLKRENINFINGLNNIFIEIIIKEV